VPFPDEEASGFGVGPAAAFGASGDPPESRLPMTERDLTVYAELLQRLNETLNEPAIAVKKVYGALREIIGSNVVLDAKPRVFRISGQEIVDWYGGDDAVKSLVKNIGLFEKAAGNESARGAPTRRPNAR
jgi:hypothetical protein